MNLPFLPVFDSLIDISLIFCGYGFVKNNFSKPLVRLSLYFARPARRRKRFSSSSGTDNAGGPVTPPVAPPPPAPLALYVPTLPLLNNSCDDIDRLMTLSTVAAAAATVETPMTPKRRKLAPLTMSGTVDKQEEEVKEEVRG